ncbi:helix-turn-helix transcriptional regulator [Amphritea balenae]|uniref:LuxR family transcriptional regulator n=1 Tax=Amphritea balenae TaxID=452629 RepID=A0A3P1SWN6_9GAMM|nr:helix-turn-helix transcriptional regulator [Amphritea balenae]RRD01458.1 LuxR family transcriptional regulator [Amphritea balenae]
MNKELSAFILLLHRTAQQLPPYQFRDWLFQQCQSRFGIAALYWREGDKARMMSFDDSYLMNSSKIELLKLPDDQSSCDHKQNISTAETDSSITGSADLVLCERQHRLTLAAEKPFDSQTRAAIITLIPHMVEAYDTSHLAYFSKIQDSDHFALLTASGTIKHCSKHTRDRLQQLQQKIQLSSSNIPFLMKYKVLRDNNQFLRTVGAFQDDILINIGITPARLLSLTPVEFAVSFHYARGLSYKEVAKVTNSSPSTVNNHLNSIFEKLKLNNKNQLSLEFL